MTLGEARSSYLET